MGLPCFASHSRMARSLLAEANNRPFGENAREVTSFLCPRNGGPTNTRVLRSHMRTAPSAPAVARRAPSGEKATAYTAPLFFARNTPRRATRLPMATVYRTDCTFNSRDSPAADIRSPATG